MGLGFQEKNCSVSLWNQSSGFIHHMCGCEWTVETGQSLSLNFHYHCLLQQLQESWGGLPASPAASEVNQLKGCSKATLTKQRTSFECHCFKYP